jgi:hypothetical protein
MKVYVRIGKPKIYYIRSLSAGMNGLVHNSRSENNMLQCEFIRIYEW